MTRKESGIILWVAVIAVGVTSVQFVASVLLPPRIEDLRRIYLAEA